MKLYCESVDFHLLSSLKDVRLNDILASKGFDGLFWVILRHRTSASGCLNYCVCVCVWFLCLPLCVYFWLTLTTSASFFPGLTCHFSSPLISFLFFSGKNMCAQSLSHIRLVATPWSAVCMDPSVHGDSPSKNIRGGCYALLQGIFPTQGLSPGLLHSRQIPYVLSHQRSPRILEWAAYPFSR